MCNKPDSSKVNLYSFSLPSKVRLALWVKTVKFQYSTLFSLQRSKLKDLGFPSLITQGRRSRGGGGGEAGSTCPPTQYFENLKKLVRKSVLCPPPPNRVTNVPPPPPPPTISKLLRRPCNTTQHVHEHLSQAGSLFFFIFNMNDLSSFFG